MIGLFWSETKASGSILSPLRAEVGLAGSTHQGIFHLNTNSGISSEWQEGLIGIYSKLLVLKSE